MRDEAHRRAPKKFRGRTLRANRVRACQNHCQGRQKYSFTDELAQFTGIHVAA